MKLLFDENLSFRLCAELDDVFPGSAHVRMAGLSRAFDQEIWQYAKDRGFTIVSQDSDFADLAVLRGAPPKVIWVRTGNQPAHLISALLRRYAAVIGAFEADNDAECLEIY